LEIIEERRESFPEWELFCFGNACL
jgi:hypothetical protein